MPDDRFTQPNVEPDPDSMYAILLQTLAEQAAGLAADQARNAEQTVEPYDHPWRGAQAAANSAMVASRVIYDTAWHRLRGVEESGQAGRARLSGDNQAFMADLRACQEAISTAFRVGLRLTRDRRRSAREQLAITGVNRRQIDYALSSRVQRGFDTRFGDRTPLEDPQWDPIMSWDYPYDLPTRTYKNLRAARELAAEIVNMDKNSEPDTESLISEYFDHLRFATQAIEEIELTFLTTLRSYGYSWENIGEVAHLSAQAAHKRWANVLRDRPNVRPDRGKDHPWKYGVGY